MMAPGLYSLALRSAQPGAAPWPAVNKLQALSRRRAALPFAAPTVGALLLLLASLVSRGFARG